MARDYYYDPFCEVCSETRKRNVKHEGFCNDCVQFLCEDCLRVHRKLQGTRGHVIRRGDDMPKSMADKPPQFDLCDVHQRSRKDHFCNTHKVLLCCQCVSLQHKVYPVESVDDACKYVLSSEIDALYDKVSDFRTNLSSVVDQIGLFATELATQKAYLLKNVQDIKDKAIAKIEKLFKEITSETESTYTTNLANLGRDRNKLNDFVINLEGTLDDIGKLKGNAVDTKVFLKIHDILKDVEQCKADTEKLRSSGMYVKMSFIPDKLMNEFLSTANKMGSISLDMFQPQVLISVPELSFPTSPSRSSPVSRGRSGRAQSRTSDRVAEKMVELSQIKTPKLASYDVKLYEDGSDCNITGIVITNDGKRLMADWNNRKIKLFSRDMKLLYSLSLSTAPWDIAVTGDREAVVSCDETMLLILDISDGKISIKRTVKLPFIVRGITAFKDKLVVTSSTSPPSVKMIDKSGRVYWSTNTKQHCHQLFYYPEYVTYDNDGISTAVVVSDSSNNTLTMMNADTGDVITRHKFKGKAPTGVTTDTVGNIYVCYWQTGEVAVLTKDLSHEKVLLSKRDGLTRCPKAIVYSAVDHQLLVSYVSDKVDCIEL